ncbi:hypothetical protein HNP46_003703 [Pseudomonas nitritireducens]|uniref:Uncharacterized protein n=1 Tax=Pseudomonas nitroreducens TaxID=46680 RepID=A0A7W7P1S5_PSENT|nr:hypothetical protein [Pseudomonas nitritireducens]
MHVGQHGAAEGQQGDGRHGAGQEGQPEGLADADDMDADDHCEQADAHWPAAEAEHRLHVGGEEVGGRAGADGQRQRAGGADQITDEGPEGQLGVCEYAAGMGPRGGKFAHAQRQAAAEHGHQQGGDEHVGPAAAGQPVVPAGELPGDDQ